MPDNFLAHLLNAMLMIVLPVGLAIFLASRWKLGARLWLIGAATYGYHALPLQTVLSFALGPIGYLLWCVPMAKSFFGKWNAIIGVVVSLIGLIGSASPVVPSSLIIGWCFFLCPRLIALWFIILGVRLFRYGRRMPVKADSTLSRS